jgi:hypothetical protein
VVAFFCNQNYLKIHLQPLLTLVFFVSISLLHISTPSVVTVHAVDATVPFNSSVIKMPGNLAHISPSDEAKNDLAAAITAIPFLWDQGNSSMGVPMGWDGRYVSQEG